MYDDPNIRDDVTYPINITKSPKDDQLRNVLVLPYLCKLDGHYRVVFRAAGYSFYTYISSHSKPNTILNSRLTKEGTLLMVVMEFQEMGMFKGSKESFEKLVKKVPLEKLMPRHRRNSSVR
jgi:hypothetical protein